MCGIVGAVAERPITGILIEGLKRLEYRGYDSAGVAVLMKRVLLPVLSEKARLKPWRQLLKNWLPRAHWYCTHALGNPWCSLRAQCPSSSIRQSFLCGA